MRNTAQPNEKKKWRTEGASCDASGLPILAFVRLEFEQVLDVIHPGVLHLKACNCALSMTILLSLCGVEARSEMILASVALERGG